jgi:hypothetical protein
MARPAPCGAPPANHGGAATTQAPADRREEAPAGLSPDDLCSRPPDGFGGSPQRGVGCWLQQRLNHALQSSLGVRTLSRTPRCALPEAPTSFEIVVGGTTHL